MFIKEFFAALIIAFLFGTVFVRILRRNFQRPAIIGLFILYTMIIWTGGIWLQPFGPEWWEVHWLPFGIVAIVFLLVIGLFSPRRPPYGRLETLEKLEEMATKKQMQGITYIALGTLFWVLLFCLIAAVIFRYI